MNWTLGVDTSSSLLSIGLYRDDKPELAFTRYVHNSHAEHITAVIKSFLQLANISAKEITKCAVVTGPGSFTGLRIGISFLKGMFISGETECLSLSSLELLANALSCSSGKIGVALDARQDNLFFASFEKKGNSITRLTEDKKISKDEFYQNIDSFDYLIYDKMGNAKGTLFDALSENENAFSVDDVHLSRGLTAAAIAASADESAQWTEALDVAPNYMQESYAERTRK